ELMLARVGDIRKEDGVTYLRVTDAGEGRRVKTTSSRRSVPLHPAIIDAGFMQYVAKRKATDTLFADADAAAYSKRFARLLDKLGLSDPALGYHCLRHTFKDACRAAGIHEEVHDAL